MKKLHLTIFVMIFGISCWAVQAPYKKVVVFANELKSLEKDIDKLEATLGKKNQKYIELVEKRKFLEMKSREIKLEVLERAQSLKGEISRIKKLLAKNLVQSLNKNEESADMLARIVLRKHLEKKLKKYQQNLGAIEQLQEKSKFLEEKINEYYGIETSLLALIEELEQRKIEELSDYREKRLQFKKLKKLSRSRRKKTSKKVATLNVRSFGIPLEKYVSVKKRRKGVDITFKGRQPLKASKDGKVSYLGNLSTFGNVLMLDHGNETRSVIFGHFKSHVKKGEPVKAGQIIGQTKSNGTKLNSINFGIWYKNKAQNTSKLFAKRI